jgi:hypothetical protein
MTHFEKESDLIELWKTYTYRASREPGITAPLVVYRRGLVKKKFKTRKFSNGKPKQTPEQERIAELEKETRAE